MEDIEMNLNNFLFIQSCSLIKEWRKTKDLYIPMYSTP